MTGPGLDPPTFRSKVHSANHYTTDVGVSFKIRILKLYCFSVFLQGVNKFPNQKSVRYAP